MLEIISKTEAQLMNNLLSLFTNWMPWSERKGIQQEFQNAPGVYVLGRFDTENPLGKPDLSQPIIYIGETCDRILSIRLSELEVAPFV